MLLLDVIDVLSEFKIPYAIIGAFAASFYGVVRASLDADAVISLKDKGDVERLCSAFCKKKLKVDYRQGDFKDPVKAVISIRDKFQNRVDLLTGIHGMKSDVFARLKTAKFMKCRVKIVGPEDFVAMKIFAGSPRDIQDALGVLDVSEERINRPLLKRLTAGYGSRCTKTLQAILEKRVKKIRA